MAPERDPADPSVTFTPTADGAIQVQRWLPGEEEPVSWLWIAQFSIRIGVARVPVNGIAGVGTREKHRMQGHARALMAAAVRKMCGGRAALSVLYGIHDFYDRFGYASAGPDSRIHLIALDRRDQALPSGWSVRPLRSRDLPTVMGLYARHVNGNPAVSGAAVRTTRNDWSGRAARTLAEAAAAGDEEECRVAVGPDSRVRGYAWRSTNFWFVNHTLKTDYPGALIIGEAVADGPDAADAVLATCRRWAREELATTGVAADRVVICAPLDGEIGAAAMRQDAVLERTCAACGGFMARTLDVSRLLRALAPEIALRSQVACGMGSPPAIGLRTDIGDATLHIADGRVSVQASASRTAEQVRIGQDDLARLALGAFMPYDVLARLTARPSEAAAGALHVLFPQRAPFIYPAERP